MVKFCCVKGCNVTTDEGIKFFKFPHNRVLRRKWIDTLKPISRTSIRKSFSAVICSQHFTPLDYVDVKGRIKLREHVVPSVFNWDLIEQPRIWNPKTAIIDAPYGTTANKDDPNKPCGVMENVVTDIIKCCTDLVSKEWKKDTNAIAENNMDELLENMKSEIVKVSYDKENVDDSITKPKLETDKSNEVIESNGDIKKSNETNDETEKSTNKSNKVEKENNETKNDEINTDDAKETSIKDGINNDITESIKSDVPFDTDNATNDNTDDKITDLDALFVCEQQMTETEFPLGDDDGNVTEHVQELCPDNIALNINEDSSSSQKNDLNKHDIEDLLTNYFIPTLDGHGVRQETAPERDKDTREKAGGGENKSETAADIIDMTEEKDDPEFIEVPVECDVMEGGASPRDCVMLLENVQVEVDPALFPDMGTNVPMKEDPISLLTSSDDDEVIIEEPHIDTVEVSDETDEDDVPLVKLVKSRKAQKKKTRNDNKINKLLWSSYDNYCTQCHFTTTNRQEFKKHKLTHTKVIQVCSVCNYTTASDTQFARHKRKHREERKFKCHICEYRARHNMSLIYHLKSHDGSKLRSAQSGFKCDKCGFKSNVKGSLVKHVRACTGAVKMFYCDDCEYETKRRSDLKRHRARKHQDVKLEIAEID